MSSTTSVATVSNSKAVPPEFTLTVLPPCPVRLEGVSVRPAKLPAGVVTVTNSTALPAEFTLSVLPAAPPKLDGVSDSPVNVELPPPPPPPPSSAMINLEVAESYFNILPSATPAVLTSVKAFIELVEVTSAPVAIPFNLV